MQALTRLLPSLLLALTPVLAQALDYRSIAAPKAVLYDAPSAQAKKLFLLWQDYPVEVIVNLGHWVKVRDNLGGLTWVEADRLSAKRTVIVVQDRAGVHASADVGSALVGYLEKDVVLDLLEPAGAWVKVRHRDGLIGYVQAAAVWGL